MVEASMPRNDPPSGPKKLRKALNYGRPGEELPQPAPRGGAAPLPGRRAAGAGAPAEPPLGPEAARAYEEIRRLLATGVTDWAVTDADTEAVHAVLEGLRREDFMAVCRRLAREREGAQPLFAKYLVRGVLDHSGIMQARWSEQFDRKVYYEGGAYKVHDALRAARAFEKEIAALVGAKLWNEARLPPSQPLRGMLAELES
jgi:hypothetical protein